MNRLVLGLCLLCATSASATMTSIEGIVYVPTWMQGDNAGDLGFSSDLLDAADEKSAVVMRAPKTGTISSVRFRTNTVTTGATMDVRMETVGSTTGDPSGTLFCTNSNASQVIADIDDNTQFVTALTAGCSVTQGDIFALVIVNPTVSFGTLNITRGIDHGNTDTLDWPYADHFTAAWSKSRNDYPFTTPIYNDGSYAWNGTVPAVPGSNTFNSGSAADEIGSYFVPNVPMRVKGWWAFVDHNANGDYDVILYDTDGSTALLTDTFNVDASSDPADMAIQGLFNSTATLTAAGTYRIVLRPSSATSVQLWYLDVAAAAVMDALWVGQDWHYTSRVDAGSWTQTTTRRSLVGLVVDGFDDGSGAASSAGGAWGF